MSDASLSCPHNRTRTLRSASRVLRPAFGLPRSPAHRPPLAACARKAHPSPPHQAGSAHASGHPVTSKKGGHEDRNKKTRHRRWRVPRQPLDVRHAEQENRQTSIEGHEMRRDGDACLPATPLPLHGVVPPRAGAAGLEASACPPARGRNGPRPRPSSSPPQAACRARQSPRPALQAPSPC